MQALQEEGDRLLEKANIPRLDLDVLSKEAALELLKALIGESRIEAESDSAKELCNQKLCIGQV